MVPVSGRDALPRLAAPVNAVEAGWVRDNVLLAYATEPTAYVALIEKCPCQWGPCGHCRAGRHEQCAARRLAPFPSPETHIARQNGGALVAVWMVGKPCSWCCPCCGRKDWASEPIADRSGDWVLFEVAGR